MKGKQQFIRIVKDFYDKEGRHTLPWRKTTDPYKIAVSEIMLQQTQVARVIEKYQSFLKLFPNVSALAKAPLKDVLEAWSGLGYNRRAKFLHKMAQVIVRDYNGRFPKTILGLEALPGIGPYTAGAIAAFAYNMPVSMIETNIRTVYIHHFFQNQTDVTDENLLKIITETTDLEHPRIWYWALMDYGSDLKSRGIKTHRASKHYVKQSAFIGSKRQIRGAVIKALLGGPKTLPQLIRLLEKDKDSIASVLKDMIAEMLVRKEGTRYSL